ncbi:hypothetical protein RRF57_010057 [Xylaria bambusicola]|uniref:Uncharacterized protein n=1 Tax=Xylaria bambusicola TaxID=326684 RepID=A0AAN7ZCH3_9PEZI
MSLFWVADPTIPRSSVKAHAAKNRHARARRERAAKLYKSASEQSITQSHSRHKQHSHSTCVTPADTALCPRAYHDPGVETEGSGAIAATSSWPLNSGIFAQSHFGGSHNPMSRFERSLVKYYVEVVISLNGDLTGALGPLQAYKAMLPVALANPVMTMGFYLCSCRSLYARTGVTRYYQFALQYKAACLRLLAESIAATCSSHEPVISDIILSTVLQLASDETDNCLTISLDSLAYRWRPDCPG